MLKKNKVVAVIQTRINSGRLPGKGIVPLNGKPSLWHIVDRIRGAKTVDDICIAIPSDRKDLPLVKYAKNTLKCHSYRGLTNNVIKRVIKAAKAMKADIIVDVTGDCPLVDPSHIDYLVKKLKKEKLDYASNLIKRTFPDGFDVQVFRLEMLEKVEKLIDNPKHRYHCGWNIIHYAYLLFPDMPKMYNWIAPVDQMYPDWGLTLDTEEDWDLLDIVFKNLYNEKRHFNSKEVVNFILQHPILLKLNENIKRNIPGDG